MYMGRNKLGGTIISPYHIMTAAHGFVRFDNSAPGECQVVGYRRYWSLHDRVVAFGDDCISGRHEIEHRSASCNSTSIQFRRIRAILVDRGFADGGCMDGHDWAIIELDKPIQFDDRVRPICLPYVGHLIHRQLKAVGWGKAHAFTRSDPYIREIPLIHDPDCRAPWSDSMPTQVDDYVCAKTLNPHDYNSPRTCHGDSGSGLEQRDVNGITTLVGITSFGSRGCPANELGRFTSVEKYLDPICKYTGMAGLNLLRRGVPRLCNGSHARLLLPQLAADGQQQRTIVNKTLLKLPEDYPAPWPYKEKNYTFLQAHLDRTKKHLHQNSKIIVVEGNIGAGKSTMAKELADLLGFHYMPEFRMDDILIDRYGNDLRHYYHLFPECCRIPDVNMFYQNPFADQVAMMQDRTYVSRWDQWLNACAHIFNTGQGVVLERSAYSDFVFVNAMRSKNFISPEYFKFYYYKRKLSLKHLRYWPHLVIYLDVPVAKCLENIRKRGNVHEINAVDEPYLKVIEESYKDSLKEYQPHSKILAYDWSTPGDTDTIIEDIERMDFDFFEWHSGDVFEEWFTPNDEVSYSGWRTYVTDKRNAHMTAFDGIRENHEVSELYQNPRDMDHFVYVMKNEVLKSHLGYGYLRHLGDERKGLWITGQSHMPEPWFEYFWREEWYYSLDTTSDNIDPLGTGYDPDYLHHH